MAGREIQVRLYRDALSTPWGFRLTGGKDVHAPLTIQREDTPEFQDSDRPIPLCSRSYRPADPYILTCSDVAIGSPVEGELQRGDVILEIQSQNATSMTHRQAQDAIRNSGGSLSLRVKRPLGQQQNEGNLIIPKAHDYLPTHRGFILGRLQETLNTVVGNPPMTSSGYGSSSLSDYGDYNSPTSPQPSSILDSTVNNPHYPTWTRAPPRQRPPTITPLSDPGWTPQCLIDRPQGRRPQTAAAAARVAQHITSGQPGTYYGGVEHPETPAWLGSLRPSVESKNSGGYQQSDPTSQGGGPSVIVLPEGAQHLQFNSPLGLYNNSNVQQVVAGHFGGASNGATNGTARPNDSDVYRMVRESDRRSQPSRGSASLTLPQSDSIRQSPSIHLLESRLAHGQDSNSAEIGITDF